jgi:hypothetical protein
MPEKPSLSGHTVGTRTTEQQTCSGLSGKAARKSSARKTVGTDVGMRVPTALSCVRQPALAVSHLRVGEDAAAQPAPLGSDVVEGPKQTYRPRRKKNQIRIRTGIGTPNSHSKLPVSMFFSLILLLQPRGAKIRS